MSHPRSKASKAARERNRKARKGREPRHAGLVLPHRERADVRRYRGLTPDTIIEWTGGKFTVHETADNRPFAPMPKGLEKRVREALNKGR